MNDPYRTLDRLLGVALGVLGAAAAGLIATPGAAMVPAMAAGMAVGMAAAMGGAFVVAPWAGMFEVMIPGMWAGMVAGMAGAMDRAMGGSWPVTLCLGAATGLIVALAFQRLDRRLTAGSPRR